jgi:VWFA-related protein
MCGLVAAQATQAPTFSSKLEVVRVDALVTDGGRVVHGLGPSDFEVRDNGVLQQVDLASFEALPLDVVLALDASDSVTGERLTHLRTAGRGVLDALKPGDRAGLLTFSHMIGFREPLTGEATRIRRALDALAPQGETSLIDAAQAALLMAQPSGSTRTLVIIFSDGHDTSSWLTAERVVDRARRSDATIYGAATRGTRRPEFLRELASVTGGSVFELESTRDLGATFVRILDEFRQRYVISFSPRGVARDGFHRLQVRVKGRRVDVKARQGYFRDR